MIEWGKDELSHFFDIVHHNQHAGVQNFPLAYGIISAINDCFVLAGKNLVHSEVPLTGAFFLRSQYAYKVAAGMALAGQIVESAQATRLCLEMAGYALTLKQDPALLEIFINRHVDDKSKKVQQTAFKIANIRAAIKLVDPKLADIFSDLYDRSIDFGGHPNPHALFSAMKMSADGETTMIETFAMTTDSKNTLHALKLVAQGGMMALHIVQHIFREKFELLGIRKRLEELRAARMEFGAGL